MLSWLIQSGYTFEGEREGERVLIFLHRHWIVPAVKIAGSVGLLFLGAIVYPTVAEVSAIYGTAAIVPVVALVFVLGVWSAFAYAITMYLLDTWIVTNERIIGNTQGGFFHRTVSELPLNRVQDVSVKTVGLLATVLHFGDLEIQTAGTETKVVFRQIPYPERVKERIMGLVKIPTSNQT